MKFVGFLGSRVVYFFALTGIVLCSLNQARAITIDKFLELQRVDAPRVDGTPQDSSVKTSVAAIGGTRSI